MLQSVMASITSPFKALMERTGTDLEPELSECEAAPRDSTTDKPLFRLFVGWVPKLFTEQDLLPLFQKFGDVKDIIILKDKVTGQPRGCAFVSYATKEEAEAAIAALNKGVHLPGALCPMEVRYARSHQYVQAGTGPEDNRQLFFARAPSSAAEAQLTDLFKQFGEVEDVNLFRERRTHVSKGCGFITMKTREQAIAAMAALDEKHLMEGATTPLAVKWADPLLQIKKRRAVEDSNAENRMLFFAKVLRSANEDEVRGLFSRFGRVIEVNLFRAFQGAPTTKGCGLVTMGSNDEAAAAIDALDNKHIWEGMEAPMVVKWMDAALQKRRREEHLAAMRQGLVPSMGSDLWMGGPSMGGVGGGASSGGGSMGVGPSRMVGVGSAGASLSHGKLLDAAAAAAAAAGMGFAGAGTSSSGGGPMYTELLPAGCAPDAYKLFVGNVPKAFTEEELRPVFEAVGPVVELVVVRDKFTHESKGSAFVWYTNKADADQAVVKFNLQRVLSDPTGEQDRPLVVRRANMRKPASALMGQAGLQAAAAGMSANSAFSSGSHLGHLSMASGTLMSMDMQQQQQQHPQPGGFGGQMAAAGGQAVGFAGPDMAYYMSPMMAMQAQQQPPQQQPQYGQQTVSVMYQPGMLQQGPVASTSDNSGSGSFMMTGYGGPAQAGGQQAMPSPIQPQPPQPAYMLSPRQPVVQPMQPMMMQQQQPSPSAMAGLAGMQQQALAMGPAAALGPTPQQLQQGRTSAESSLGPMVQLSLQVTGSQLAVVQQQMYSIQAMSGAEISMVPVAAGLFHLIVTGAQTQVTTARQLITSVLS